MKYIFTFILGFGCCYYVLGKGIEAVNDNGCIQSCIDSHVIHNAEKHQKKAISSNAGETSL